MGSTSSGEAWWLHSDVGRVLWGWKGPWESGLLWVGGDIMPGDWAISHSSPVCQGSWGLQGVLGGHPDFSGMMGGWSMGEERGLPTQAGRSSWDQVQAPGSLDWGEEGEFPALSLLCMGGGGVTSATHMQCVPGCAGLRHSYPHLPAMPSSRQS